jgi:glutathione-regulated potassium-efflux system protein KefB
MASEAGSDLIQVVALLGAGVIAVPIFKRLGLGSVLGYLVAGVVIGPWGIGLFREPSEILHVGELGVVMFLFIIGLEMRPSRLWGLRRDIFGLGLIQVMSCCIVLTGLGIALGLDPKIAFIAAAGFVMSSTAIIMQMMEERGDASTPAGQRNVAILLLEDLAIVPLLAIVALLAPGESQGNPWIAFGIAVACVLGVAGVGIFLLNPMFRLLAAAKAREVMTAAALLVVLGAALIMDIGGLSMAMGAFAAGVLLSESTFRHQLEADIEPFRGILLGLFFLSVGMSLDLGVLLGDWQSILIAVGAYMAVNSAMIYIVGRLLRTDHREALTRAALFAQGGEFAFVLYGAAALAGIISGPQNAVFTATVVLSMAVTPLLVFALRFILPAKAKQSMEGVDKANGLSGSVLIIGYGRFGQVVSQPLLARGFDLSVIDSDTELIRTAYDFGFKVYYGDGTRIDILRAAGAQTARVIVVCTDDATTTSRIVEIVKSAFPLADIFARAFDRGHALKLIQAGVAGQMRETFHSAIRIGEEILVHLGVDPDEAAEVTQDVLRRDAERLEMQIGGGIYAGRDLLRRNFDETKPATAAKPDDSILPIDPPEIPEAELEDLVDETSS